MLLSVSGVYPFHGGSGFGVTMIESEIINFPLLFQYVRCTVCDRGAEQQVVVVTQKPHTSYLI